MDMVDDEVIATIHRLVDEEHRLHGQRGPLSDDSHHRLRELEVELDQCWDLLRQRRALRRAGQDPSDAEVRGPGTVEGYQQ
jgi:hypothetical protein